MLPALFVSALLFTDIAFRFLFRRPGTLWGGNFAVERQALLSVGGFNKDVEFYGEDTELSLRLAKVGKIKFNKKQIAFTSPRRFEHQPLLRTIWPYISVFVHLIASGRYRR